MGKEALHALIEQVKDNDIDFVYVVLTRLVRSSTPTSFEGLEFEEEDPLPDEVEAFEEYEEAKAKGEKFYSHEEVWGKVEKKREKVA